jgi:hypothetical protein
MSKLLRIAFLTKTSMGSNLNDFEKSNASSLFPPSSHSIYAPTILMLFTYGPIQTQVGAKRERGHRLLINMHATKFLGEYMVKFCVHKRDSPSIGGGLCL